MKKKKNLNIRYLFQELTLSSYIAYTNGISSIKNKLLAKQILLVLTLILGVVSMTAGEISVTVFLPDGNTPLALVDPNIPHIYRDVMVGTNLIIVVSSDVNEYWGDGYGNDGGSFGIEEEYRPYGALSARGPEIYGDWSGSHLPAAGHPANVFDIDYPAVGFDLYTGSHDIEAGNWFVIDYNATDIGNCNVGFYDHRISWDEPIYYLSFSHVRTRDFSNNTIVDFHDYAILASHWLETNCNASDWCEGADLDTDGSVDVDDLMLFCEFWLERTK
jgi:hypothetical protein